MSDSCYGSAAEKLRRLLYCSNQQPPFQRTPGTMSHRPHEPMCELHNDCYMRNTSGPPCRCAGYKQDAGGGDSFSTELSTAHPRLSISKLGTRRFSKGAFDVASYLKELQPTEDLLLALFNHSEELDDFCEALKNENDVLQEEVKILRKALEQCHETRKNKLNENLAMLERLVQSIEECRLSKEESVQVDTKLHQHSVTSRIEMIQLHGRLQQSSNVTRQLGEREKNARARVREAVLVATEAQLQAEQYANRVKELERELEHVRRSSGNRRDSL